MTLLLALTRRVPAMLEEQARRNWSRLGVSAKATSVEGKVMAIIGYGHIGREIALRAKTLRHPGRRGLAHAQGGRPAWMKATRCPRSTRCSRAPTS